MALVDQNRPAAANTAKSSTIRRGIVVFIGLELSAMLRERRKNDEIMEELCSRSEYTVAAAKGVVTAAEMLSIAAFEEGRHAQAFPELWFRTYRSPCRRFLPDRRPEIRLREPIMEPGCPDHSGSDPALSGRCSSAGLKKRLHHPDQYQPPVSTNWASAIMFATGPKEIALCHGGHDRSQPQTSVGRCPTFPARAGFAAASGSSGWNR